MSFSVVNVRLQEEERQMVLLALAHLAVARPGWDDALGRIALYMDTELDGKAKMYEHFKDIRQASLRLGSDVSGRPAGQ